MLANGWSRALLELWGTHVGREAMQSLLRSALTDEQLLEMFRGFPLETVLTPLVAEFAPDERPPRATLLASQVVGLAMARYVAALEPLASAAPDTVVAAVAPTLQQYLTGDLHLPTA